MSISLPDRNKVLISISSWLTFAISLTFYWITADPGASYWDSPEYVTVASKMEIGHPPGNPIWMLAMRVATIPFPSQAHAYVINLCSGLFMAFAAFFLCRTIFVAAKISLRNVFQNNPLSPAYSAIISCIISIGSSLCYSLCDSAWFSAVEAEVYAMSAFLTALSIWIMVEWWFEKSKSRQYRLLILLAYLTGLSLGVHQLNLLLIPVFTVIIFYKKNPEPVNPFVVFTLFTGAVIIIGLILLAFIPGILYGAESFELFGVNIMGLPYDSGVIIFLFLLFGLLLISLILTNRLSLKYPKAINLNVAIWMGIFILIGFSSFGMVMIRSNAAPPMNEGSPDNIFALTSYIQRDQYPSTPLLYGETPYSRPILEETFIEAKPVYNRYVTEKEKGLYLPVMKDSKLHYRSGLLSHNDSLSNSKTMEKGKGYILSDYKFSLLLTPELDMWFPRLTSRNIHDRTAYESWGGMTQDKMERVTISQVKDSAGNFLPKMDVWGERKPEYSYRPTYSQNLSYFLSYQLYYMYFRYLFWNFIGRQNDFPSQGEIEHGNFVTGIPAIDTKMLGDIGTFPKEIYSNNKGRNIYYGIPFILGIIGICWLASGNRRKRRSLTLTTIYFIMTGVAIVVYLNQTPGEPRERDYTFLGSYMAFAMWISAGILGVTVILIKLRVKKAALILCSILSLGTPTLMALENFDDHDRRNRFETTFYASSILDFEEPAIIFSQGDNSTFPLWYASEVLDMGKNHTPVDVTYLSLPSYVANLKKQGDKGISSISSTPQTYYGKYLITQLPDGRDSSVLDLREALRIFYNSDSDRPIFPVSKVRLPSTGRDSVTINLNDFTNGSHNLSFKHLMLLDILASQSDIENPKVLFFPSYIDRAFYKALENTLKPALFGKIYAPWMNDSTVNTLLERSIERELIKLEKEKIKDHYVDPVIADRSVRYRGELIMAAFELLQNGDTILPVKIARSIEKNYPYSSLLPGSFTSGDSTYYEGREFVKLTENLYELTGDTHWKESAANLDSLNNSRKKEWLKYYQSLSPEQRSTLSNRSKRLLIK